ncbi:MAG: GDP-mannose 4,6-dehydratase [Candidatus Aminicenantes bacterium]|nr:GDP-mannose 4,6-dehydratase [Candidatus Aminicenantes bacterium]
MNKYKNKKVLVTGAGGFIGSFLTELLIDRGAEVSAFIWHKAKDANNLERSLSPEKIKKIKNFYGDLRDSAALPGIIKDTEIIFHLAAVNSVHYSLLHPKETLEININGTINLLLAAREFGAERVVLTSSAGVYGPARYLPIDENHPTNPASPYAAGKLAGEEIASSFYRSFKLPVVILRPFNTFGPGQGVKAVIPTIILQALKTGKVKVGRLDSTRDFNYVSNTAAGLLAAGSREDVCGEVFNIASGAEHSIEEIIETVGSLLNKKLEIATAEERQRPGGSEADRLCASIEKARRLLSYEPEVSFREGLLRTIEYYRTHIDDYTRDFEI